jgi:sterol desaturase/sphingolipid hydroxylase (fatty acid hydroxylase superfamily)
MVPHLVERATTFLAGSFSGLFLSLGSTFSIASLLSALCIAISFLLLTRRAGRKVVPYRVMWRALFPGWARRASFRADLWFLFLNLLASAVLLGWTVVSSRFISDVVSRALTSTFGVLPKPGLNELASRLIVTVALFLAYELAYWVDHYLSHRIPVLWEFHKVHHTAEVLSPITNFRVHPVDSVIFYNFVSIFLGATGGVLTYLQLGRPFAIGGANAILVAFIFVTVHLQHSHVWIPITGPLGRLILSPAHHQIHHSDNPIHYDTNYGGCLSFWDWVFGTLHMPQRRRERLIFGVGARTPSDHSAVGCLIVPFLRAWERARTAKSGVASPESGVSRKPGVERESGVEGQPRIA